MTRCSFEAERVVALVNDIHVGSPYSLWPKNFSTEEGNPLLENRGQKIISDHFEKFVKLCDKENVDTVIFPGDLIHGNNRKEFSRKTVTADLNIQVDAAKVLLEDICKDRIVHIISGTRYHESIDYNVYKELTLFLAKVAKSAKYQGLMSNFEVEGVASPFNDNLVLNVSHGVSSAQIYRTTLMDRGMLFMAAAYGLGELHVLPDVIIRGHWHIFGTLNFPRQMAIQSPGWSAWSPFKATLRVYGKQSHIGGVILYIMKDGYKIVRPFILDRNPRIEDYLRPL